MSILRKTHPWTSSLPVRTQQLTRSLGWKRAFCSGMVAGVIAFQASLAAAAAQQPAEAESNLEKYRDIVVRLLDSSNATSLVRRGLDDEVAEAVAAAAEGAEKGDERMARAFALLTEGKVGEAEPLFEEAFRVAMLERSMLVLEADRAKKKRHVSKFELQNLGVKKVAAASRHHGAIAGLDAFRHSKARHAYMIAVKLDPDHIGSRLIYGLLELNDGGDDDAEESFIYVVSKAGNGATTKQVFWARFGLSGVMQARHPRSDNPVALARALEYMEAAKSDAERLSAADPTDEERQYNLAETQRITGDLLVKSGDPDGAVSSYRQALVTMDRFAETDERNAKLRSYCHFKIGDTQADQGDFNSALSSYRRSVAIVEPFVLADVTHTARHFHYTRSQIRIGDLLVEQGDFDGALSSYRQSLEVLEGHFEAGSKKRPIGHLEQTYSKMGNLLAKLGKTVEAKSIFLRWLREKEQLYDQSPGPLSMIEPLQRLADLSGAEGRPYLERTLAILREYEQRDRLNDELRALIPFIEARLAEYGVKAPVP